MQEMDDPAPVHLVKSMVPYRIKEVSFMGKFDSIYPVQTSQKTTGRISSVKSPGRILLIRSFPS